MPFIQDQNKIREDYKVLKKSPNKLGFVNNRTSRGLLFVFLFALVVPLSIYYFIVDKGSYDEDKTHTCNIDRNYRIRCGDYQNVSLDFCSGIDCCFDNATKTCFHYVPSKYYYYQQNTSYRASRGKTPFNAISQAQMALTINEKSETNVEIILHDVGTPVESTKQENPLYNCSVTPEPMYVDVYRKSSQDLLLTTSLGPTIASKHYWEWSFQLTEEYLFGLGEVLIKVEENTTMTRVIYGNDLDHNTLPLFLAYKQGQFHGLMVRHKGPLEVTVLPSLLVSIKSLAGKKLALELAIGPTIKEVTHQLKINQDSLNNLDFGDLGVHVCREGTTVSLKDILKEYSTSNFDFKYESDCIHQNLLMALSTDSSKQPDLVAAIADLKENKTKRFMFSLPPQVLVNSTIYEKTKNLGVFYMDGEKNYEGKYLGKAVTYPDFGHKSIVDYIQVVFGEIQSYLQIDGFDGLILNENWPADEAFKMEKSDDFQYLSKELIDAMSSTLPWDLHTADGDTQMAQHVDYGSLQLSTILQNFPNIPFTLTASHNSDLSVPLTVENFDISWGNFEKAIAKTLYNGLFGNYLTSIPVCGSTANYDAQAQESLCIRWYLMASTAPLFRISSDLPRRDPDSLNTKIATKAAKRAIDIRYSLRSYYYTVLKGHKEPLMRPMFYDFPEKNTFGMLEQYMVGPSVLVAHPTVPDKTLISVYLPEEVEIWYEFWSGNGYNNSWITFDIVETDWIGFIPHGSIIPINLETGFKLIVALNCQKSNDCGAFGSLLVSSDLFTFSSTQDSLTINATAVSSSEQQSQLLEIAIYENSQYAIFITNITGVNLYNTTEVIYSDYL